MRLKIDGRVIHGEGKQVGEDRVCRLRKIWVSKPREEKEGGRDG